MISNKIILETLELLSRYSKKIIKEFERKCDDSYEELLDKEYDEFKRAVVAETIYNETKEKYKE